MKKFKLSEEQKLLLPFLLIGAFCVVIALVIAYFQGIPITDYTAAVRELGQNLLSCGVMLLVAVPIAVFLGLMVRYIDWNVLKSIAKRISLDFSNFILMKNSEIVSYRLRYFFFGVLSRNNQVLHFPLGEDFSCLTPHELVYGCRDGCVFYNFDLILPQKPDVDTGTLRKIIQSCIDSELCNHRITSLDHCFQSKVLGRSFWSVYLDRVTYYEAQHRLTFEVLYVCTEKAAEYLVKAIQRDTAKVQPEREFFDDEL